MNYELAKQLKDAGFPQEGKGEHLFAQEDIKVSFHKRDDGSEVEMKGAIGVTSYAPTLSELIEACGNSISGIEKNVAGDGWIAHGYPDIMKVGFGSTPEEAVAKIWLAINGKNEVTSFGASGSGGTSKHLETFGRGGGGKGEIIRGS